MKSRFLFIAIILLIAAGIGIIIWNPPSTETETTSTSQSTDKENAPESSEMKEQKPGEAEKAASAESRIVYLPEHSPKRTKQIVDEINAALASDDMVEVSRAFRTAAYSRAFKNSEMQEAFKHFLDHANPYARFLAAEYLYLTGDNSGRNVLLNIMQLPDPLIVRGVDRRSQAAQLLIKYRETSLLNTLVEFYEENKSSGLLHGILMMSQGQVPASIYNNQSLSNDHYGLFILSLINPQLAVEKAKEAFSSPKVPEIYRSGVINTAAWVMVSNENKDPYLAHLIAQSEKAIGRELPSEYDKNVYREALKYLGSIDNPQAREVLETGLQSESGGVVQYSAVNLLFNQSGGYEPVKQRLLYELDLANVKDFKLGAELKWNLVKVMANDPEISNAAQAYSERSGLSDWEYHVVERGNWPIYNWIDNYVVKLNRTTP